MQYGNAVGTRERGEGKEFGEGERSDIYNAGQTQWRDASEYSSDVVNGCSQYQPP